MVLCMSYQKKRGGKVEGKGRLLLLHSATAVEGGESKGEESDEWRGQG